MRLSKAAIGGAAWAALTVLPTAVLAWVSTHSGALKLLGLPAGAVSALIDTADEGWPKLWALTGNVVSGPWTLLAMAAALGAGLAPMMVSVGRRLRLDPGGLALSSLGWMLRNSFRWPFLLLAACLAALFLLLLSWERKPLGTWLVAMPLFTLLVPWQVSRPNVVAGKGVGSWWRPRVSSWRQLVAAFLVLGAGFALDVIPWVGDLLGFLLMSAGIAHVLLRSPDAVAPRHWRAIVGSIRWTRWLCQWFWALALLMPAVGVLVACSLFNIYGAPVVASIRDVEALPLPVWWEPYSQLVTAVSQYWWIAVGLVAWPWSGLLSARLAWQEISADAAADDDAVIDGGTV